MALEPPRSAGLYEAKEAMHSLYRTRGRERAKVALAALTDRLAGSQLPELQTLRRTLIRWRHEILEHFATGLHQRPDRGLQQQGEARKKAGLRL
jgi:transposase